MTGEIGGFLTEYLLTYLALIVVNMPVRQHLTRFRTNPYYSRFMPKQ